MKHKIIYFLTFAVAVLFVFTACDKIEDPFSYQPKPIPTDDNGFPELPTLVKQSVLLEDYTAHKCPNCYKGAETAHTLIEKFGSQLVVIGVHCGSLASTSTEPYTYDFKTPEGTTWYNYFKIPSQPSGIINRLNGGKTYGVTEWEANVESVLQQTPEIGLQVLADWLTQKDSLQIKVKVHYLSTLKNRNLNLTVLISEDSIVKPQLVSIPGQPSIDSLNYVHSHVMRAVINGTWGGEILDKDASVPQSEAFLIPTPLFGEIGKNKDLVAKNCRVVAFVSDRDTKEILQVVQEKITIK